MVKRLWEWSIVQAESMSETGIVTGLFAAPLLGVVTEEDADSAVVVDMARDILGNPYDEAELEEEPEPGAGTGAPAAHVGEGAERSPVPDDQVPAEPEGAPDRDPGVTQVGGGPEGRLGNGDEKSGRGEGSSSSGAATVVPDAGTIGVPEGGVASPGPTGGAESGASRGDASSD